MENTDLLDQAMEHHRAGRLDEAMSLYGRILEAQPNHVDALNLAGAIAYQRGDDVRAVELLGRAVVLAAGCAEPQYHLGLALRRQGKLEEAANRFGRAIELTPAFALAHYQLGLLHQDQGQLEAAAACFQQAQLNDPSVADFPHRLAEVLLALGRPGEAAPLFEQAVTLAPNAAVLHTGLGDAWQMLGKLRQAADAYQRALALEPKRVQAWWGLGCAADTQGEYAVAAECFQQVVKNAPDHGAAHHNLGKALFELGQTDAALEAFRAAAALLEDPELSLGMIATILPGSPRADQQSILEARRAWATRFAPAGSAVLARPPDSVHRRLRVGYVSAFFQDPNWMKPVWGLVNHHDRERFEIHLFSDAPASAITHGGVKDERDRFHDVSRLTNRELARLIVAQAIDILVDLNGYSRLSRLPLFASRPAPIVVAWFNMYATSGMDCFDCLIGDRHVFAAGEEASYSEKVVCVPGCYLTFEVTYPVPDVAPAPCRDRGVVTFGCLAPQYKITTAVADAWARILHGSPGSRLILKNRDLASANNRRWVHELFARFGIPPERVELDGPAAHFEFLKKYGEIDVALDTFPYNGGTTTMEALWQGVPVLTFYGDRWASRISASLLRNAGLPEFVAADVDGYVAQAIALATEPSKTAELGRLRLRMRDHLARTPVCDTLAFAQDMEREYLRLWETKRRSIATLSP